MILRTSVLLAALFVSSEAQTGFFTYEKWLALSEGYRAAYIAGAYDSLVIFVESEQAERISEHYLDCVRKAQMTDAQLAENVKDYEKDRPELHTGTVQGALAQYLFAACGKVPKS